MCQCGIVAASLLSMLHILCACAFHPTSQRCCGPSPVGKQRQPPCIAQGAYCTARLVTLRSSLLPDVSQAGPHLNLVLSMVYSAHRKNTRAWYSTMRPAGQQPSARTWSQTARRSVQYAAPNATAATVKVYAMSCIAVHGRQPACANSAATTLMLHPCHILAGHPMSVLRLPALR